MPEYKLKKLNLPKRAENELIRRNIFDVDGLLCLDLNDLANTRGIGWKTYSEIEKAVNTLKREYVIEYDIVANAEFAGELRGRYEFCIEIIRQLLPCDVCKFFNDCNDIHIGIFEKTGCFRCKRFEYADKKECINRLSNQIAQLEEERQRIQCTPFNPPAKFSK